MAKGKAIAEAVRWIIIRLSTTMTEEEISMYTDIGVRSIQRILAHFRQNGGIDTPKLRGPRLHKSITDYDIEVQYHLLLMAFSNLRDVHIQYMHNMLERTPDLYLDEMRLEMQEVCGILLSLPTIWRTLVRSGYTMKKAQSHLLLQFLHLTVMVIAHQSCDRAERSKASPFCCSDRNLPT